MKQIIILALLTAHITHAAVRAAQPTPTATTNNQAPEQPQIIYIPVPITPTSCESPNEQQQRDLFLTFMSIAGNFGKILLNPDDTPHVIEGVNTIIDSIMHAADIATRASNRAGNNSALVQAIAHYIQQQAKLVQHQATDSTESNASAKNAREQLLEYALEQTAPPKSN